MITQKQMQWLVFAFLAIIVAVTFQQIYTSMTEQGIASGGPYNNGAAYPRAIAIAIAGLALLQLVIERLAPPLSDDDLPPAQPDQLKRGALLLVIFAVYLGLLKTLGYHLTTGPMVFAIMWTCGARNILKLLLSSFALAFVFAYAFEKILNVVLPGGVFGLNIPW